MFEEMREMVRSIEGTVSAIQERSRVTTRITQLSPGISKGAVIGSAHIQKDNRASKQ